MKKLILLFLVVASFGIWSCDSSPSKAEVEAEQKALKEAAKLDSLTQTIEATEEKLEEGIDKLDAALEALEGDNDNQ